MFKTSKKFKITLIFIILAFIFTLKEEIIIGLANAYRIINKPDAHRMLGEIYSQRSYEATKKAAYHFQIALSGYKNQLTKPELSNIDKGMIEFIIGTHYECGRGVNKDIDEAKVWYKKSIESGFVDGAKVLEQLKETLNEVKNKVEQEKQK